MGLALFNSLASPYSPTMRAVYQVDNNDSALLAYLDQYSTGHTTGSHSIDRTSGSPVLSWQRWHHYPDATGTGLVWSLSTSDTGRLTLPAAGQYVIATGSALPPSPALFDPAGWWPCDITGTPMDSRVLQSPAKVSRTKVAVGRSTLQSGSFTAGQTTDLSIVFDTPAAAVPESGWVQIQPGVAWLGKTRAVVKDGSITTTGCTVTVTVMSPIVLTALQPVTYEAVCLYTYLADV